MCMQWDCFVFLLDNMCCCLRFTKSLAQRQNEACFDTRCADLFKKTTHCTLYGTSYGTSYLELANCLCICILMLQLLPAYSRVRSSSGWENMWESLHQVQALQKCCPTFDTSDIDRSALPQALIQRKVEEVVNVCCWFRSTASSTLCTCNSELAATSPVLNPCPESLRPSTTRRPFSGEYAPYHTLLLQLTATRGYRFMPCRAHRLSSLKSRRWQIGDCSQT